VVVHPAHDTTISRPPWQHPVGTRHQGKAGRFGAAGVAAPGARRRWSYRWRFVGGCERQGRCCRSPSRPGAA